MSEWSPRRFRDRMRASSSGLGEVVIVKARDVERSKEG